MEEGLAKKLAKGASELKFLLTQHKVAADIQGELYENGIDTVARFAAAAADEADLKAMLKDSFSINPSESLKLRAQAAGVVVAWKTAISRVERQAEAEATNEVRDLAKPIPSTDYIAMRQAFAAKFGELEDKHIPAKEYIEKKLAELESGEFRAEPLTEIIRAMLEAAGDPDRDFLRQAEEGLPVGILDPLPRTPHVFEEQLKWPLENFPYKASLAWVPNYSSVEEHADFAREKFEEDVREGLMAKMTMGEFLERYGEHTAIAALAVIVEDEELDKKRIIHDATHGVRVNHRIKCRDKLRSPGAREKKHLLREHEEEGETAFSVVGDIAKAHRRYKHAAKEHGYLACQVDAKEEVPGDAASQTVYVNQVGTFGLSCASYWWTRIAACGLRLTYHLLGPDFPLYLLLYADDLEAMGKGPRGRRGIPLSYLFLATLGYPFKWAKTRGGFRVEWLGMETEYPTYKLGLSLKRATWLVEWLDRLESGGRLQKPEPLLEGAAPLSFFTDAKAEAGRAWIGGFLELVDGCQGPWFSLEVVDSWAPWAFAKGDPGKVIAALELLATLVGVRLWVPDGDAKKTSRVAIRGYTDNQSNESLLRKAMTTKFPSTLILMELAEELSAKNCELQLQWIRRDLNQLADDLTNENFASFDPNFRIDLEGEALEWRVLGRLVGYATSYFEELGEAKRTKKVHATRFAKRARKLGPW